MKEEKRTVFNENILKAWDIQRQCAMEEYVRVMRQERICPIYNNNRDVLEKKGIEK